MLGKYFYICNLIFQAQKVQNLYKGAKSQVKTVNGFADEFSINKGLRQGCCISPTLFKINIAGGWKRIYYGIVL